MNNRFNSIVLVGRSDKFLYLVRSIFDDAEITTIPWRSIKSRTAPQIRKPVSLIVVCGYDYASSHYSFEDYFDINVLQPYKLIKSLVDHDTKIVYVDTEHGANLTTYSRYQYAKNQLLIKLYESLEHVACMNIPTVINTKGEPDIQGGMFTKLTFKFLIATGLVRTISYDDLKNKLFEVLNNRPLLMPSKLTARFLFIRRTLFIDRLLRFIGG